MEHRVDTVGFLHALGQRVTHALRIAGRERLLGDAAQAGQRCPQVVRDVVQGAAHAGDHAVDAIEHRVHEAAQLAERVAGIRGRYPRVRPPRAHDAAHRLGECTYRLQARARDDGAASQGDHHHEREIDEEDAAEALEQFAASIGALADLQQRAVGQPHRGHFQHVAAVTGIEFGPGLLAAQSRGIELRQVEAPPLLRHAEEHEFLAGSERAHEERARRGGQVAVPEFLRESLRAADHVGPRVLHERALDRLPIVAAQRGREQDVGERHEREGAGDEDRGVPQREAQAQRVAPRVTPPG